MFNAALLRCAREALQLTQLELSTRTRLEQSDISRWERGLRQPTESQLVVLGTALEVSPQLLLSDVRLSRPVHRTARQETKAIERKVNARLELSRLAVSRLLEDVELDVPFAFPDSEDSIPEDPEAAADALRRLWRLGGGPLPDLCALIESAGAIVLPVDFGTGNVLAAYSHQRDDHRWCFINSRARDGAQLRFSLAHEIGHALLHWDRLDAPVGRDAEREAHRFAAALLLPRDDMYAIFTPRRLSFGDLMILRTEWRVSMQALIMRASDLGLVTSQAKQRFFMQMNARGWRKQEPGEVLPERPSLVADALDLHRSARGFGEAEIASMTHFSPERLEKLMPELFRPGPRPPRLRITRHRD